MYKKIITIITIFTFLASSVSHANATSYSLFNSIGFKSTNLKSVPKWVTLLSKMKTENKELEKCDLQTCDNTLFNDWLSFIAKAKKITDPVEQLDTVNSYFNEWEYILDIKNWGVTDYWEIPSEFLEFSGDCEDYAIIKYYTLKKLGYDVDNLKVVILKDTVRNGAHAVLAVAHNNKEYILDNLSTIALTDDLLTQYQPYYSINEYNKWIYFKKFNG